MNAVAFELSTPERFSVETTSEECVIRHVRHGTLASSFGLRSAAVCFAILAIVWVWLALVAFPVAPLWQLVSMGWSSIAVFLGFTYRLAYSFWSRKTFRLKSDSLQIDTELLGFTSRLIVPRDSIEVVRQVDIQMSGHDQMPVWKLELVFARGADPQLGAQSLLSYWILGLRSHAILWRLPHEDCEWLGIVLARWANVDLELKPAR